MFDFFFHSTIPGSQKLTATQIKNKKKREKEKRILQSLKNTATIKKDLANISSSKQDVPRRSDAFHSQSPQIISNSRYSCKDNLTDSFSEDLPNSSEESLRSDSSDSNSSLHTDDNIELPLSLSELENNDDLLDEQEPQMENLENDGQPAKRIQNPSRTLTAINKKSKRIMKKMSTPKKLKVIEPESTSVVVQPIPLTRKQINEDVAVKWIKSDGPSHQYNPQIMDWVVFFPQGYRLYCEKSHQQNALPNNQEWVIYATIISIKYHRNPRLCEIELKNDDDDTVFSIKYREVPGIVEFLMLAEDFKLSNIEWKENNKFYAKIDGLWWPGTVNAIEPCDAAQPESQFLNMAVTWDNGGERDKLSEFEIFTTIPDADNNLMFWPQDRDKSSIVENMDLVMGWPQFSYFLDSSVYHAYPVDLNLIKRRIANGFYRRVEAADFDNSMLRSNHESIQNSQKELQIAGFLFDLLGKLFR